MALDTGVVCYDRLSSSDALPNKPSCSPPGNRDKNDHLFCSRFSVETVATSAMPPAASVPSFRTAGGTVCRGPPGSAGVAGLNVLVANTAAAWQWLDVGHTHGFVGNFNQTNLIPLNWTFLNDVPVPHDAAHRPQQSHAFEPNENHKTVPILLDLARFP